MNQFFGALWLLNLVFSLLYTLFVLKAEKKSFLLLFFIALPVVGFLLWQTARLTLRYSHSKPYNRQNLLTAHVSFDREREPSLKKALDLTPMRSALAVGSKKEKRELLLKELQKDPEESYEAILPASADPDSESARYAAAGILEIAHRKRAALQLLQGQVSQNPKDLQAAFRYMTGLWDFLNSGLVSSQEAQIYQASYCRLFEKLSSQYPVTKVESAAYLSCLISLGQKQQADFFWRHCREDQKSEACYQHMLELYYREGRKDAFFQCLDALKQSDILLSPEGLQMLRFWDHRRD